ncbi:MAG: phosphoribosyl isomerase [Micromonosporaceae bacterium]|nr:phosphoribosyl isomerase [Micromonosporaceae bacterium]
MAVTLLPTIDVAGGRVVRGHGATAASGDPLEAAFGWKRDGVAWVHLVDVDAADGRGANTDLIARAVQRLDLAVALSAGVADDESLRRALSTGAARVNLSPAALADLDWCGYACATYGDRVAVGLDVRGHTLAVPGRRSTGDLFAILDRLDRAGCARYVVDDVLRDGTPTGPNVTLLLEVCGRTSRPVVACGGVSKLDDLRQLAALGPAGVEGVIVDDALRDGAFTVAEALAALSEIQ